MTSIEFDSAVESESSKLRLNPPETVQSSPSYLAAFEVIPHFTDQPAPSYT